MGCEGDGGAAQRLLAENIHLGVLVGNHQQGFADLEFGVADAILRIENARAGFDGAESFLVELDGGGGALGAEIDFDFLRSEEHTSELQSLMRISYAVFCLKKKKTTY